MSNTVVIFIVKLKNDVCVWNSERLKFKGEHINKQFCWHFLYNFLQSLSNKERDPVGFYCKANVYGEEGTLISDIKYYYAGKMRELNDAVYRMLDGAVGYEILLWDDEYIPQAMETIE